MLVAVALAIAAHAQTYQIGSDTSNSPQATKNQTKTGQSLGWGTNIQNARLAHAAQLALQHGDRVHALEYARRAVEASPNDPQLLFMLGYAARLNGKCQDAADAYNRGLRISPSSAEGLSGLAQDYSQMGRTTDAERLLKQALSIDPGRLDDAELLGELEMRSKDYSEAVNLLERTERSRPDARTEVLLALSYEQLKQMDLSRHYLELAKKRSPNSPDVQRTLAGYFRGVGDYTASIAALNSIHNPTPDVKAELAYTYQLDGKMEESAKVYAQAADALPRDAGLQLSAAQAEVAAGAAEKAGTFLKLVEAP